MSKPLLVLKFGTASITQSNGEPDERIIAEVARQVAQLHQTYRIVIVSSGAVGAGKHFISNYTGEMAQRKAAAAVGNPLLLALYAKHFANYGLQVAQSLCERQHFAKRQQFLQLKETYQALWESNIIPIANENDVVSNRELKFSDNDELATLIAVGFGASTLMICTQSGGLLDKAKNVVPLVEEIDDQVLGLVDSSKSSLGTGGMASKLTFTKLANRMGIKVVIFGMKVPDSILLSLESKTGSTFLPQLAAHSSRNKWLVSGGLTVGKIQIDEGATKALLKRNSLLAVGIVTIKGDFDAGEVIEILDDKKTLIAVARTRCSSTELHIHHKMQGFVVAHANDIVLV